MSTLYCCNNEMKANRVLYKLKSINTNAKEENKQVPCMKLFCSSFVIYLGFFVCNLVMNHSDQERLFTVKVLTAFLFSLLIFVFTIHNFPKCITANKVSIFYKDYLTI